MSTTAEVTESPIWGISQFVETIKASDIVYTVDDDYRQLRVQPIHIINVDTQGTASVHFCYGLPNGDWGYSRRMLLRDFLGLGIYRSKARAQAELDQRQAERAERLRLEARARQRQIRIWAVVCLVIAAAIWQFFIR